MSLTNTGETYFLDWLFRAVDALSGVGTVYASLHSADPGEAGNQGTSELAYTGYVRVAMTRSGAGGWTVAGNNGSNSGLLAFGKCTAAGGVTGLYVGIGLSNLPTAGTLLCRALVSNPSGGLIINVGITPEIAIGDLDFNAD